MASTIKTYQVKFTGDTRELLSKLHVVDNEITKIDENGHIQFSIDLDENGKDTVKEVFDKYLNDPENAHVKLQVDYDRSFYEANQLFDKYIEKQKELKRLQTRQQSLIDFDKNDVDGAQKALNRMMKSIEEMDSKNVHASTIKARIRQTQDFINSFIPDKKAREEASKRFEDFFKNINAGKYEDALNNYKYDPNDNYFSNLELSIRNASQAIDRNKEKYEKLKAEAAEYLKLGAKPDKSIYFTESNRTVREGAGALSEEADAFEDVAAQAAFAALAKWDFVNNNKLVIDSAKEAAEAIDAEAKALKRVSGNDSDPEKIAQSYDYVAALRERRKEVDRLYSLSKDSNKKIAKKELENLDIYLQKNPELAKYAVARQLMGGQKLNESLWQKYMADIPGTEEYLREQAYNFKQIKFDDWLEKHLAEQKEEKNKSVEQEKEVLDERVENAKEFLNKYKNVAKKMNSDEISQAMTGISEEEAEGKYKEALKEYRKVTKPKSGATKQERADARYKLAAAAMLRKDPYSGMSDTLKGDLAKSFEKVQLDLKKHQENLASDNTTLTNTLSETRAALENVFGPIDTKIFDDVANGLLSVDDAAKKIVEDFDKRKSQQPLYSEDTMKKIAATQKAEETVAEQYAKKYNGKKLRKNSKLLSYFKDAQEAGGILGGDEKFLEGLDPDELEKKRKAATDLAESFDDNFGANGIVIKTKDGFDQMVRTVDDLMDLNIQDISEVHFNTASIEQAAAAQEKLAEETKDATTALQEQSSAQASSETVKNKLKSELTKYQKKLKYLPEDISEEDRPKAEEKVYLKNFNTTLDFIKNSKKILGDSFDIGVLSSTLDSFDKGLMSIDEAAENLMSGGLSRVDETMTELSSEAQKAGESSAESATGLERQGAAAAEAAAMMLLYATAIGELIAKNKELSNSKAVDDKAGSAPDVSEAGESLDGVKQKASDAATEVLNFIRQNDYIKNSAEGSYGPLNKEVDAFNNVATAAEAAAKQKEAFKSANEGIPGSAQATTEAANKEAEAMKNAGEKAKEASKQKEDAAKQTEEAANKNPDDVADDVLIEAEAYSKQLQAKAEQNIKKLVDLQVRDSKDLNGYALNQQLQSFIKERDNLREYSKKAIEADPNSRSSIMIQDAMDKYETNLQAQMERVLIDLNDRVFEDLKSNYKEDEFGDKRYTNETHELYEHYAEKLFENKQRLSRANNEPITDVEFDEMIQQIMAIESGKSQFRNKDNLLANKLELSRFKTQVEAEREKYANFDISELDNIIGYLSSDDVTQGALSDLTKQFKAAMATLQKQAAERKRTDAAAKQIASDRDIKLLETEIKAEKTKRAGLDTSELDTILSQIYGEISKDTLSDLRKQFDIAKTKLSSKASEQKQIDKEIADYEAERRKEESDRAKRTATNVAVDSQINRVNDLLAKDNLSEEMRTKLTEIAKALHEVKTNGDDAKETLSGMSKVDLHEKAQEITNLSRQIKIQEEETRKAEKAQREADAEQKKADAEQAKISQRRQNALDKAKAGLYKKLNKTQETLDSDKHLGYQFNDDVAEIRNKLKNATNANEIYQEMEAYNKLRDSIDQVTASIKENAKAEKAFDDQINMLKRGATKFSEDLFKDYEGDISGQDKIDKYKAELEKLKKLSVKTHREKEAADFTDELENNIANYVLKQTNERIEKFKKYGIQDSTSAALKTLYENVNKNGFSFDLVDRLKDAWKDADDILAKTATVGKQKNLTDVQKKINELSKNGVGQDVIDDLQGKLDKLDTSSPVSELEKLEEEIKKISTLQNAKISLDELVKLSDTDADFASEFGDTIKMLQGLVDIADVNDPIEALEKLLAIINEVKADANSFTEGVDEIVKGYEKLQQKARETANIESKIATGKATGAEQETWLKRVEQQTRLQAAANFDNSKIQKAQQQYEAALSGERQRLLLADAQKLQDQINKKIESPKYSPAMKGALKEMNDELDAMKSKAQDGIQLDVTSFIDATGRIKEMRHEFEQMGGDADQLASLSQVTGALRKVTADIENNHPTGDVLANLEQIQRRLSAAAESAQALGSELTDMSKVEFNNLTSSLKKWDTEMYKSGMAGKGFFQQFKDSITSQSASFLAQYFSLQDFIRYGREIVSTVTEVDSKMTELRKVSGETDKRLAESFERSTETATRYGATISDIIASTADWSRLGYKIDDAEELARVTQIYQNVGDNLTQETASEYLVSTLQGFHIAADDAMSVVDSINSVANNYAVDTQMIGESLERSAASFNAAGTDLNKSIALVSATAEVTQDAASAGTVWKTTFCFGVQKCASRTHLKPVMPKALLLQCG